MGKTCPRFIQFEMKQKKYTPYLTEEEEKILKRRHEIVYDIILHDKRKELKLGKFRILSDKDVFPPWKDSLLLANSILKKKNLGCVLDLGCGTGIQAIAASLNAKAVLATDVNEDAVQCTKKNIQVNKIKNIEVRRSDLFKNIKEKFDTIIFNPPFRYFKPKDKLDAAMTDENYQTLTKFFSQVKSHLKSEGKVYMCFSNLADLKYFEHLVKKNKFRSRVINKSRAKNFGEPIKFYYYIYELARIARPTRKCNLDDQQQIIGRPIARKTKFDLWIIL